MISVALLGIVLFSHHQLAWGDEITLENGARVTGTLQWDGILAREDIQGPSRIAVSEIREIRADRDKVLLLLQDESWVSCRFASVELQIDREGIWQLVRADTVDKIVLNTEKEDTRTISLLPPGTTPLPSAEMPPTGLPGETGVDEIPFPLQTEQGEYLSLESTKREGETPVPTEPKSLKEPRKRWLVALEGGGAFVMGDDRDLLADGPGFGVSVAYEWLQKEPYFLAAEFSFLRTMHDGRNGLRGVTQNTNPTMVGIRGGRNIGKMDLFLKLQAGVLLLDASQGTGGRNETIFGLQWGGGLDYHLTPWIAVGSEVRCTQGMDSGNIATWLNLLARISFRF